MQRPFVMWLMTLLLGVGAVGGVAKVGLVFCDDQPFESEWRVLIEAQAAMHNTSFSATMAVSNGGGLDISQAALALQQSGATLILTTCRSAPAAQVSFQLPASVFDASAFNCPVDSAAGQQFLLLPDPSVIFQGAVNALKRTFGWYSVAAIVTPGLYSAAHGQASLLVQSGPEFLSLTRDDALTTFENSRIIAVAGPRLFLRAVWQRAQALGLAARPFAWLFFDLYPADPNSVSQPLPAVNADTGLIFTFATDMDDESLPTPPLARPLWDAVGALLDGAAQPPWQLVVLQGGTVRTGAIVGTDFGASLVGSDAWSVHGRPLADMASRRSVLRLAYAYSNPSPSALTSGFVERFLAATVAANDFSRLNPAIDVQLQMFSHADCAALGRVILAADPPIHATIGTSRSSCSIATAGVLGPAGMPQIDFASTSPRLSNKTQFPTFFRIPPSDTNQGLALAHFVSYMKWTKVGIVAATDVYTYDLAASFESALMGHPSIRLTASVRLDTSLSDTPDLAVVRAAMQQIKDGGSAINLLILFSNTVMRVMTVARELGMVGPGWTWLLTESGATTTLDVDTASALVGAVAVLPNVGSGAVFDQFVGATVPNGDLFRLAFTSFTSVNGNSVRAPSNFVAPIRDAVFALGTAFVRSLASKLTSDLAVNETWPLLLDELRAINSTETGFDGAIGTRVFFNANQDGPLAYTLVNARVRNTWAPVGSIRGNNSFSFSSTIIWADNKTQIPSDKPPVVAKPPSSSSRNEIVGVAVGLSLGVLVLLTVIGGLIIAKRRASRRLRESQIDRAVDLTPFLDKAIKAGQVAKVPREIPREHFQSLEDLGSGAFGVVVKGVIKDPSGLMPEFPVATKMLRPNAASNQCDDLLLEASIMAQFDHPHIAYEVGITTVGQPFLLHMAYCERGNLQSFLKERTGFLALPLTSKLIIMHDIADGMKYLEALGYVHRDLACRNVLLASDFKCKITDFGLSRELSENEDMYVSSAKGQIALRWSSPESLAHRQFSSASDVWSYGVVLHEIMTNGELPYKSMSNNAVYMAVQAGFRLEIPPGCPQALYKIMRSTWKTDPKGRPTFEQLEGTFRHLCRIDEDEAAMAAGSDNGTASNRRSTALLRNMTTRRTSDGTTSAVTTSLFTAQNSVEPDAAPPPIIPRPSVTLGVNNELTVEPSPRVPSPLGALHPASRIGRQQTGAGSPRSALFASPSPSPFPSPLLSSSLGRVYRFNGPPSDSPQTNAEFPPLPFGTDDTVSPTVTILFDTNAKDTSDGGNDGEDEDGYVPLLSTQEILARSKLAQPATEPESALSVDLEAPTHDSFSGGDATDGGDMGHRPARGVVRGSIDASADGTAQTIFRVISMMEGEVDHAAAASFSEDASEECTVKPARPWPDSADSGQFSASTTSAFQRFAGVQQAADAIITIVEV